MTKALYDILFLECLHCLLFLFVVAELILKIAVRLTVVLVLIDYLCYSDLDGLGIIKATFHYVQQCSSKCSDLWMIIIDIFNFLMPGSVECERVFYRGKFII